MLNLFIVGFIAGVVYLLVVVVHPVHRCPRCKGDRVVSRGGRPAQCTKCKGHGRAYRLGAPMVHRLLREHIGPQVRERIREAIEARRQQ